MSRLFLVDIQYLCGESENLLVKAETLEEARARASVYKALKVSNPKEYDAQVRYMPSDDFDLGEFEQFDHAIIGYAE